MALLLWHIMRCNHMPSLGQYGKSGKRNVCVGGHSKREVKGALWEKKAGRGEWWEEKARDVSFGPLEDARPGLVRTMS